MLIVDDNVDSGDLMALLANFGGHEVAVACDGTLDVGRRAGFMPERALLGIGLPGIDGYELMRQLRDAYGDYLVVITGYGREEDRKLAQAAGSIIHRTNYCCREFQALLISSSRPCISDLQASGRLRQPQR